MAQASVGGTHFLGYCQMNYCQSWGKLPMHDIFVMTVVQFWLSMGPYGTENFKRHLLGKYTPDLLLKLQLFMYTLGEGFNQIW